MNDKLEYNRSTIPFPDDRPPTEEETKAETNVKTKINQLRTEYLRQKAESKPKPTPKPKKNSKQKPIPNPNPEPLNSNKNSNEYSRIVASNLVEMKPMHNEDWFALNNDNMDNEWRRLCSIDLDLDLKHHIDLNKTQHGSDLIKPKTMHNVKINDWFTMNNDNIDIE